MTVYVACAVSNHANYAVNSDGDLSIFTGSNDPDFEPFYNTDSAYECCVKAIKARSGSWQYDPTLSRNGCAFVSGFDAIQCRNGNLSRQYLATTGQIQSLVVEGNGSLVIMGNGYCSEWTGFNWN